MKRYEYRADSQPFGVPYSATEGVDPTKEVGKVDRPVNNDGVRTGNLPGGSVATSVATFQPFPLRTLLVCFTIWLIATQAMIFDQVKFDERAHLLEQATQSLGGPRVIVPNERPSKLPSDAKVQRL
jgi:hypothetical protein